jgi:hypothetical protein
MMPDPPPARKRDLFLLARLITILSICHWLGNTYLGYVVYVLLARKKSWLISSRVEWCVVWCEVRRCLRLVRGINRYADRVHRSSGGRRLVVPRASIIHDDSIQTTKTIWSSLYHMRRGVWLLDFEEPGQVPLPCPRRPPAGCTRANCLILVFLFCVHLRVVFIFLFITRKYKGI